MELNLLFLYQNYLLENLFFHLITHWIVSEFNFSRLKKLFVFSFKFNQSFKAQISTVKLSVKWRDMRRYMLYSTTMKQTPLIIDFTHTTIRSKIEKECTQLQLTQWLKLTCFEIFSSSQLQITIFMRKLRFHEFFALFLQILENTVRQNAAMFSLVVVQMEQKIPFGLLTFSWEDCTWRSVKVYLIVYIYTYLSSI